MKIVLDSVRKPAEQNVNKDMQWIGESFGLFNLRDREKSCFRIFVEIVKSARKAKALSTDELASKAHLTRATVIYHLSRLTASGLVVQVNNCYALRENNLSNTITEMRKDVLRAFESVGDVAKDIDEELGLKKKQIHTFSDVRGE